MPRAKLGRDNTCQRAGASLFIIQHYQSIFVQLSCQVGFLAALVFCHNLELPGGIITTEANSFRISYQTVKIQKQNLIEKLISPACVLDACLLLSYDFKGKSFSCKCLLKWYSQLCRERAQVMPFFQPCIQCNSCLQVYLWVEQPEGSHKEQQPVQHTISSMKGHCHKLGVESKEFCNWCSC